MYGPDEVCEGFSTVAKKIIKLPLAGVYRIIVGYMIYIDLEKEKKTEEFGGLPED